MITRLIDEMREALHEFREDPRAYVKGALTANAGGGRRKNLLRVAIAILFYSIAFISMLVFWSLAHQKTRAAQTTDNSHVVISLPRYWPKADMREGADQPGGGGGGGRKTVTPPSTGDLPISSLAQLVMAPRPEPSLTPPALPMIERVMVDPRIQFKHDDLTPTGLPDGATFTPSAGQGSGGGMGVGDGPGVGQGRGGNTGGEDRSFGVGRLNPAVHQTVVDERPILLNQPHPLFTEEARKNKVQGVVRVRILVDTNGAAKEVVVMRGLPDGLNEQAIRAAYQMRFRPAMKNGQPVVYWLNNVEVEFNLR